MKVPKPTAAFESCPAGNQLAQCIAVIDMGTQTDVYDGEETHKHKIVLRWELADEAMSDGQPFIISKWYTFSMHERATLRMHLESWRGRPFDDADFDSFAIEHLLGVPCLLDIQHKAKANGDIAAKIVAVTSLPKGMEKPGPSSNHQVFLSLDPSEFNQSAFDDLSDSMQEHVRHSPEYQALATPEHRLPTQRPTVDSAGHSTAEDDDIPF